MRFFCMTLVAGFFLLSTPATPSFASPPKITGLKGYAQVIWTKKKQTYSFDQAIVLEWPNHLSEPQKAVFETLSDFGDTLFWLDLHAGGIGLTKTASKKINKLLSLPLGEQEFVSYLLYRLPENSGHLTASYNRQDDLIAVEKKSKTRKNRYTIYFQDLKMRGNVMYPGNITITSSQASLKIIWQDVQLKKK